MSAIKKKNRNCFVAKLSQTEEGSWEPLFFFFYVKETILAYGLHIGGVRHRMMHATSLH